MPRNSSERRNQEHLNRLREQDFYRVYRAEYADLTWVRDLMARLEARPREGAFSDQDLADLGRAREIMDRVNASQAAYNPHQPRDPDGRWTQTFDAQKAVDFIKKVTKGEKYGGKCAHVVAQALETGGIKLDSNYIPKSGSAYLYGPALKQARFETVDLASSNGHNSPPDTALLQPGDVVVIQPVPPKHLHGHMAMYGGGTKWYSDAPQENFWPNQNDYGDAKPAYTVYRYKNKKK